MDINMDIDTNTKIYRDLSFLIQGDITISILCQRIYYHMMSHYDNELDGTYNKAEKIANVVEIELNYLDKKGILKELTIYNLYHKVMDVILINNY